MVAMSSRLKKKLQCSTGNSIVFLSALLFFFSEAALACPTCIGDAGKDRVALLTSMMVLFIITIGVLAAFGAFFFYIQRRSSLYRANVLISDSDNSAQSGEFLR